ncbi:hypothetical protein, partial [Collinsella aerofaciens]|uniref:hypothetical protein n=1 Tax=Collinsella aerofaciens TaxID=74426 RepID=UPI00319DBE62
MHEKISRDLSLASPRLDALTDLTDVPELLTLGAMPQYEARWSWSGNLPMLLASIYFSPVSLNRRAVRAKAVSPVA